METIRIFFSFGHRIPLDCELTLRPGCRSLLILTGNWFRSRSEVSWNWLTFCQKPRPGWSCRSWPVFSKIQFSKWEACHREGFRADELEFIVGFWPGTWWAIQLVNAGQMSSILRWGHKFLLSKFFSHPVWPCYSHWQCSSWQRSNTGQWNSKLKATAFYLQFFSKTQDLS